jgi:serine/threonine protein kinase/tetratricopeptide (TPR) repeat protein
MRTRVSAKVCETCGSTLDIEAPSGFCPACLLTTALEDYDSGPDKLRPGGTRVDDYEIISEVARGGMGIVYRARQRAPARVVALKMILPSQMGSSGAIARFRAEAEAVASLDHETILPVYAVGEKDGAPFYSMKFAEGGNLSARIPDLQRSPREAAALIATLARAVAYAHEHGIVHRDLKPGNVLFDGAGKPFVSDFGLAKWLERDGDLTQTLAIVGTPFYMAPEQAAGENSLTGAADIYSLGAMLFHLVSGAPPFQGENAMEVLRKAAEQPVPRLRRLNRRIPADLETICLKCLEKNPAARYASASDVAGDLERFLASRPIRARRAGPAKHFLRWTKRNPVIAGLAAATICLAGLLVLVRHPPTQATALPKPGIAVLPFEDLSGDTANTYLANGIHDDLLVNLSKIHDLKVVSRRSVMPYKNTQHKVREIGKELDVTAVLEGSVRHVGSRARFDVQLIDCANDAQIWAQSYDRELTDIFALQGDLAFEIASALKANLTSAETARVKRHPTENGEAYLLYIQANDIFAGYAKRTSDLQKAEQLYERAIALDPAFALAYAQLSHVETIFNSGHESDLSRREKARAAAAEALRLQPELPEAHMALAFDYFKGGAHDGTSDYAKARAELEIARRGLPNDPEIYSSLARIDRHQGKWLESIANFKRAAALDPNNPERWHRLFYGYELVRDYSAAAAALDRAMALDPNSWPFEFSRALLHIFWKGDLTQMEHLRAPTGNDPEEFHTEERVAAKIWLRRYDEAEKILRDDPRETFPSGIGALPKALLFGDVYLAKGDIVRARESFEAARPVIERLVKDRPLDADAHMTLADVYAGLGRKEDAIRESDRAAEIIPVSNSAWAGAGEQFGRARVYAILGEVDRALPVLAQLLAGPSDMHVHALALHPDWDKLRPDPRFQQLLNEHARNSD